jgi:hypothetical protein
MTMQDQVKATPASQRRVPWNKGKLTGAKPPLRPKHVWSIRTKLQIEGRARDLAMFNLAIDSKLRGCDVVAIRVEDSPPAGTRQESLPFRRNAEWEQFATRSNFSGSEHRCSLLCSSAAAYHKPHGFQAIATTHAQRT